MGRVMAALRNAGNDLAEPMPPAFAAAYGRYTDVEAQAQSFDGWDLRYLQISGGLFEGTAATLHVGGIRLMVEDLNRIILQRGSVPADRVAIAVPLELTGHARMCGEKSDRDSLHVFSGQSEFEFFSPDKHVLVNVEVDVARLSGEASRRSGRALLDKARAPLVPMPPEVAQRLRGLLRDAMAMSTGPASGDGAALRARFELFERTVLFALLEALESRRAEPPGAAARRTAHQALLHAIQQRLEDPELCPLSIAEMCTQFDVSRRTIQYAFQDVLNVNPIAYLRAVRLNHVRSELRRGESVTAAATQWGFWHLSSFAHDYRVMFGELPSATARKHAARDA